MIIIVDAYNLLKHILHSEFVAERQKKDFIWQLSLYGKKKGHKIILVFDGGAYGWPGRERINGIYVIHSGAHESADDYIKQYLTEHKSQDILLVSTDREIGRHASLLGIESIDAMDFYYLLREVVKKGGGGKIKQGKAVKMTEEEKPELDDLMREGSRIITGKGEDDYFQLSQRKRPAQKLSKKERQLLKKIKKL